MILGLGSYSYGWAVGVPGHEPAVPMDETVLLDRARCHGVRGVQICDNLSLLRCPPERRAALAREAAALGIRLEVGSRGLTPEHLREMIALAHEVGAPLLRFVIDGPGHHPSPAEAVATIREVLPLLNGLTLGLENHDRFPAGVLRDMVEGVGSEWVGICLDTVNSLGAGEGLATVVAELAPLTVNLHIKDFMITRLPHQMGFTVEGRPAGAGMLDVGWILRELAPFQRCQSAILELWTPPEADPVQTVAKEELWVEQSLAYLRPFFKHAP
jgi:sugar phosphate isomerase/epimerase